MQNRAVRREHMIGLVGNEAHWLEICVAGTTIVAMIEELRAAVDALNDGNAEPFLALIDEDSEWRGVASGHLWWKQTPS
jgi:hypothetical protein